MLNIADLYKIINQIEEKNDGVISIEVYADGSGFMFNKIPSHLETITEIGEFDSYSSMVELLHNLLKSEDKQTTEEKLLNLIK